MIGASTGGAVARRMLSTRRPRELAPDGGTPASVDASSFWYRTKRTLSPRILLIAEMIAHASGEPRGKRFSQLLFKCARQGRTFGQALGEREPALGVGETAFSVLEDRLKAVGERPPSVDVLVVASTSGQEVQDAEEVARVLGGHLGPQLRDGLGVPVVIDRVGRSGEQVRSEAFGGVSDALERGGLDSAAKHAPGGARERKLVARDVGNEEHVRKRPRVLLDPRELARRDLEDREHAARVGAQPGRVDCDGCDGRRVVLGCLRDERVDDRETGRGAAESERLVQRAEGGHGREQAVERVGSRRRVEQRDGRVDDFDGPDHAGLSERSRKSEQQDSR